MIYLVGKAGKRAEYFAKACENEKTAFQFVDIDGNLDFLGDGDAVKIDPIVHSSAYLDELENNISHYHRVLEELSNKKGIVFLNKPQAIRDTLDKRICKMRLEQAKLPVTPMLKFEGKSFDELIAFLQMERISQVFIKTNSGSGASGVVALRYNPKMDKLIAETSLVYHAADDGTHRFINTKKLRRITSREEIARMVDFLLSIDSVVELWLPKAKVGKISYDLRAVYQFGRIAFLQVRGSYSPITNLHLNNMPLSPEEISLSNNQIEEIGDLCRRASGLFDGLNCAGFDILIEKNTKKPYIIEINAQGDLMYQDIFYKNRIYTEQAKWLAEQFEKNREGR
ncbi:MAG: STM4014 family protein [Peptostreptococcaceae bacterium]|nr:STM4014 family protein [Peptostreptococcaceae bacterium]